MEARCRRSDHGTSALTTAEPSAARGRSALTMAVAAPAVRASTIQIQVLVTTGSSLRIGDLSRSVERRANAAHGGLLRKGTARRTCFAPHRTTVALGT